ncbi:MAG: hypothetical protein HZB59_07405 [Ignavibacteriales bacterium]|nr:hypothetical protein [Ignavibacteriales bacterium]
MKIPLNRLSPEDQIFFDAVRSCLSPDLLTTELQRLHDLKDLNVKGHCFVATHACFHLFAKDRGFQPNWCNTADGGTHWWLCKEDKTEAIDPTYEQAQQPFPYDEGKSCNVYTIRKGSKFIDKRSNILINRVQTYLNILSKE